jgi:hypothetical protein
VKKCDRKPLRAGLNKISVLVTQDTGVGYYRQVNPASFMDKYLADVMTTALTGQNINFRIGETKNPGSQFVLDDSILYPVCKNTDIVWTTILHNMDEIMKVLDLREWTGPKWIVDIDDNIYSATKDNPAQKDVQKILKNFETCLLLADGITISVPMLKDLYAPFNKNFYVQKNCINFNYWKNQPPKKHKGIRIGWEGAHGHKADVEMVYPVIQRLIKDYPEKNIQFVIIGPDFGLKYEYHKWVTLKDYPKKLADLDLDIGIAPLIDSNYNRCKSNVRILENSALKYPIVASPTENQKNMPILYAKNNFDWYSQLEKLILSKDLREKQGQEQYDFVKNNYDMSKNVSGLYDWFRDLKRRTDVTPTSVPKL